MVGLSGCQCLPSNIKLSYSGKCTITHCFIWIDELHATISRQHVNDDDLPPLFHVDQQITQLAVVLVNEVDSLGADLLESLDGTACHQLQNTNRTDIIRRRLITARIWTLAAHFQQRMIQEQEKNRRKRNRNRTKNTNRNRFLWPAGVANTKQKCKLIWQQLRKITKKQLLLKLCSSTDEDKQKKKLIN